MLPLLYSTTFMVNKDEYIMVNKDLRNIHMYLHFKFDSDFTLL